MGTATSQDNSAEAAPRRRRSVEVIVGVQDVRLSPHPPDRIAVFLQRKVERGLRLMVR